MIETKKQNKMNEEENLVLPQFGCKCGLEYSTLSSLSNHIKMTHNNNADEWKIKRGVPEGRRQRLNPLVKEKIKNFILKHEVLKNCCGKLNASQCRGIFMQNIKYIEELIEKHNLNKQQEIILQKEHIKFQELWNDIDISQIQFQTQQYLNAFCTVFFNVQPFIVKKEEEQEIEEQKQETISIDVKSFNFYKDLIKSNKPLEITKEQKQKNYNNSLSSSPSHSSSKFQIDSFAENKQNENQIKQCNQLQSNKEQANFSSSTSNSPSEQSYLIKIHSSLNLEQDQYMRNFFNNYLLKPNQKN
ncbi:zinc finger, C2H2 type family protein (macronuclear) [Tetrahymena thermophila SB210]|uniref:Zinc finger, C2H2 type family protein n=1 Tax=Tetrahymena thermophila (strain SB210) TaxID=312017 RepID=I7M378_TETTS|nr:zinc finger, C2H2 type family protein [Tetrahymena thermophila SB210]EAS02626.1 zinc finger, C2H2 type family protein [Tetrahymena thermophila SB210]|eukprot:XP_001022871.1 zinc finger, C2H2 type family protein [Tetrahymena thermophila SB210]